MKIFTLFALLLAIVAVVFSLQNSTPVVVQFLGWQTQESMALVLLLTFTLGVLFELLISVPHTIKRMRKISKLKRKLEEQAYTIEELSRKLTETTSQVTTLQSAPLPGQNTYLPDERLN